MELILLILFLCWLFNGKGYTEPRSERKSRERAYRNYQMQRAMKGKV